jgi:catechol 2,3-dioxygenase-like lactoylglutathione lyase family enzyme
MFFPRTLIQLNVADADHSAKFYVALLGASPTRRDSESAVFELDSPPLLLTLTRTSAALEAADPVGGGAAKKARSPSAPEFRAHARFALVVTEPEHVGHAAIALRRAGVPLRLEDAGIATHDPDGNGWRVRFVPFARAPAVLTIAGEGQR